MKVITGLFDDYGDARDAASALEAVGIPSHDISFVANDLGQRQAQVDAGAGAAEGAGIGAVVGGAGGLLAGLTALIIPGVGPVIAGGWLAATTLGAVTGALLGSATGGLVGALTDAGVSEEHAHVYAESVRRGAALVTVRVDDSQVGVVENVLNEARQVDVETRRSAFEEEGWEGFDPDAPPYSPDEIQQRRNSLASEPPV